MSGGAYDYVYQRIWDIEIEGQHECPRRAAFQKLLGLVATAMHDIEWVDSGDCSPGDEHAAIDACFADVTLSAKAAAYDQMVILFDSMKEHSVDKSNKQE